MNQTGNQIKHPSHHHQPHHITSERVVGWLVRIPLLYTV
jgi:hypothetical protein